MEIRNERIDFSEIVNDITANLKYRSGISDHDIDVRVNIQSDGYFYSDKNRIIIILNNLISNAIRYANPGAAEPFVAIKITTNEREADIVIEDNGIGIDKAFHEKIFEMFYRVSHNSVGSGLGLYLVKECLKKLSGTIKVESEKGKGTAFYISIPNKPNELRS
jgi:signal transduction histidine kinase